MVIKILKKQRKKIGIVLMIGVLLVVGVTTVTYISVKGSINSYTSFEPITILDKDDIIVDYISVQKGENASIEEIPEDLRNAFITVEDKRFYKHFGVDVLRLGKAVIVNLSKGRVSQGGSTISQQLAKNAFLSNERTFTRKFKELIITFEIERLYSKDEILEKYLNEIYFGSGSYGVREAAMDIFNKDISEVNLAEAAMLAGIPNRPNRYNPRKNLENALKRGNLILRLMYNDGLIDESEYNRALSHKFVLEQDSTLASKRRRDTTVIVKDGRRKRESTKAPDFNDVVEDRLDEIIDIDILSRGGLKVYTTLDTQMQKIAQEEFNSYSYIRKDEKMQGAMVTIDAATGEVRSLIGGKDYRSGNFNRAINTKRQIGSTFKPFIYYTAMEDGYTMNQMMDATNKTYGKWSPKNYGNAKYTKMTLLESLERSINTVAVKLLNDIGLDKVKKNFESTLVHMTIEDDLTSALGSMSASPLDLAASYIPFASGGKSEKATVIRRVEDLHGNVLYERENNIEGKNFDSINISLTTSMLEDVVKNGSAKGAKLSTKMGFSVDQGGKTGTTNDFRSAWYAGFTPEYVTVVYMGYDDNTPMPNGSSGGRLAVPLWF